jgi:hypothetical protein
LSSAAFVPPIPVTTMAIWGVPDDLAPGDLAPDDWA